MGNPDKDYQVGPERSNEYPGRLAVRMSIGCRALKFHTASPELKRHDVVNLWRSRRSQAAIPELFAVWWREQVETDRGELMATMKALSIFSWFAYWYEADH
jgi:hypothetical protein